MGTSKQQTCLKSTIETLKKDVQHVQSNNTDTRITSLTPF